MEYKIAANIKSLIGASTELTEKELESLTDGVVDSGIISLTGGDEVTIVCDLFNRFCLSSCRYYFTGDTDISVFAAESYNLWYSVPVSLETGYAEIDLSSYKPRWIKIVHASSSSASIYEVEVYSEGTNVLFGFSGQFDSYGMDVTGSVLQPVQVFNGSVATRDINVFIENDDSGAYDESLSLGLSSSGTFYSKYAHSLSVPLMYSWDNGVHDGTIATVSGHLTLSGVSTSGTYYSPVFDTTGYENCRFFWSHDGNGEIDYVSSVDSEPCFGVRRSHLMPSGTWVDGTVPEETDPLWSLSTGSLEFEATPNGTILEFRGRPYTQFVVTVSGQPNTHIYSVGLEVPVTLSGVGPGSYGEVYLKLSSPAQVENQLGLLCWYKE